MLNPCQEYNKKRLGKTIRMFRRLAGLTLEELSTLTHVSSKTLARIEYASTSITVSTLYDIAVAVGVSPAQILERADNHTHVADEEHWPNEAY